MRKVLVPVIMFALGAAVAVWLVRARPVEGQATAPQPRIFRRPGRDRQPGSDGTV